MENFNYEHFEYEYYKQEVNAAFNFCNKNINSLANKANITPDILIKELEKVKDTMLNNSEDKMLEFWDYYLEAETCMEQVMIKYTLKNLNITKEIYFGSL